MQLTYHEALDTIIEHTEMGYTIASQDRLWIAFTHDLWSTGDMLGLKYNRLYPRGIGEALAYDLDMTGVLVWTTRAEAEHYAERWREWLAERLAEEPRDPAPEVYVMNLGDDARQEAAQIGRYGVTTRATPKFKGSEKAWAVQVEMREKWADEVSPVIFDQ